MFLGQISNANCLFWQSHHVAQASFPLTVIILCLPSELWVGKFLYIPLDYPLFRYFKHLTALVSSEEDATEK